MFLLEEIGLFVALVQIIVENYSTETWPFWALTLSYAIFAYPFMPELEKPSARDLINWMIAKPMLLAGGIVGGFFATGTPPDPIFLGFGMALMAAFMMGNMIALLAHLIPVLVTDQEIRVIFRRQPIGFTLVFGIFFIVIYQLITMLTT